MKPIVRVFSNFTLSDFEKDFIRTGIRHRLDSSTVVFNKSGRADFAIVLNSAASFRFAYGPSLRSLKVLMEPQVTGSIFHRFTHHHSPVFDRVLCHNADPAIDSEIPCPPMIPPHAITSFHLESPPKKTKLVSAIGSTLTTLPLHQQRSKFLDSLEFSGDAVDVFGKGRRFLKDKSDGLLPYMYSIAIENTISEHYWTEKLTDCFLSWTVPVYAGDPGVENIFPRGAVIMLDAEDLTGSWDRVRGSLSREDYYQRFDAISQARKITLDSYNLGRTSMETLLSLAPKHQLFGRFLVVTTPHDLIARLIVQLAKVFRAVANIPRMIGSARRGSTE